MLSIHIQCTLNNDEFSAFVAENNMIEALE